MDDCEPKCSDVQDRGDPSFLLTHVVRVRAKI